MKGEDMYESPINQILGELQMHLEGETLKAVQNVGIDVNKEELIKALQYDRGQYEKGYKDGCEKAIDEFAERIKGFGLENNFHCNDVSCEFCDGKCDECEIAFKKDIDQIVNQMKGNEFFNSDSPVVRVDEKSYNKAIDDFINKLLNWKSKDEDYKSFSDVCYEVAEKLKGGAE